MRTVQENLISSVDRTLFGISNGQLEIISIEFQNRLVDIPEGKVKFRQYAVVRFTDHDLEAMDDQAIEDAGLRRYYELEFPIFNG